METRSPIGTPDFILVGTGALYLGAIPVPKAAWLGQVPEKEKAMALGWGSSVLRNAPLLGSEVSEESEQAEDKQIWATDM